MDKILAANWGRKTSNENDSSQREQRRKQIESLFTELIQLRTVPNDDNRFQLTLHLNNSDSHSTSSTPNLTRTSSSPSTTSYHSSGSPSLSTTSSNSTATLTIYLPPGFPEDEPKITIQPPVRHLWVDCTANPCVVTGHDKLLPGAWSTHSNVGRIVKDIVNNIQKTGVLIGGDNDNYSNNGATGNNYMNKNSSIGNTGAGYDEYSSRPPPPIPGNRSKSLGFSKQSTITFSTVNGSHQIPAVGTSSSSNFSSVESQSNHHTQTRSNTTGGYSTTISPEARIVMELAPEQIEEYLENPLAFDHFFDQLEVVVNSRTLKNEWWHGNDNVARRTLQLEAEMLELQKNTTEGYQVAMQLQKNLEEKLQLQQDVLWRFKPETLQSKLRSAAAESDELSESIAQSFLEGKLDQEGFIRQFRELRKVYHLREMKNERIGPILRNHPSISSGSGSALGITGKDGMRSKLIVGTGGGGGSGSGSGSGPMSGGVVGGSGGSGSNEPWVVL